LIAVNPAKDVRLPKKRQQAGDRQTISREEFTTHLLPAVPERHRAIVALAGGTGLRWGECVGLRWESVDLSAGTLRVERVAVEVNGHVTPKPYPKSRAGRRVVPVPLMVGRLLEEYRELYGTGQAGEVFINEAGPVEAHPLPVADLAAVDRAGRTSGLGRAVGGQVPGDLADPGWDETELFKTKAQAVKAVSRNAEGGLRVHDLRHSYASWLITSRCRFPTYSGSWGTSGRRRPGDLHTRPGRLPGAGPRALATFSLPDEG
jgi:integrase